MPYFCVAIISQVMYSGNPLPDQMPMFETNHKENRKENHKEIHKLNRKENHKESRKENCKENHKENQKESSKENCKETHKENLFDPVFKMSNVSMFKITCTMQEIWSPEFLHLNETV